MTPRPGHTRTNPVSGERITFLDVTDQLLRFELLAWPDQPVPPLHVHPSAAERFVVHDGQVRITAGRHVRVVGAGEDATAPPGVTHSYRVIGDESARMTVELTPPGGMPAFLDAVYALAEEGRTTLGGQPRLRDIAALFAAHGNDIVLPGVPIPLQRAMWRALTIGRDNRRRLV